MIETRNPKRRYNWSQAPRDAKPSRWSGLYASLNERGVIWLSRLTHEALGEPDSYLLLFDRKLNVLGVQPARLAVTKNAYPALERGSRGGRVMHGHRMMREFNLYLSETVWFPRCFIDESGTLILELNDVRQATKKKR